MIDALNRPVARAERQGGLRRRANPSAGWLAGAAVLGNLSLAPHLQSALAPWTDSISRSPPGGALEAPEIWGALLAAGLACWAIPAVSTLRSCQSLEERLEALGEPYMEIGLPGMIRKRAGWLCALFLGEMLTATAMGFFEHEISKAVVLALFIPLIISSGGNSGNLYSSWNSANAESDRRGQPSANSPLTMFTASPSTLV